MRTGLICTLVAGAILAVALIPGGSGDAAFPGENGQMVYSRQSGAGDAQLYTRQANGSFATPLTFPPTGSDDLNPAWSADGSTVAFERLSGGAFDVRLINADGTGDVALPGGEDGRRPSWAPDGKRLVFERDEDLFAINLDGGGLTNLTENLDSPAFEADWSPDGTQIAFKTQAGDDREPVFIIDSDGSNPAPLESVAGALQDGYPDWSPDGTQIAYDQFNADTEDFDVFVVNTDGIGRVNLTADIETDAVHPVFSPDGTKILFENRTSVVRADFAGAGFEPAQLFMMNVDGSNKENITEDGLVAEIDPDWGSALPEPTPTPIPGQNVVWGDNRCDGELDTTDGLAVLRHVAALSKLTQTQPCPEIEDPIHALQDGLWGDVDCDQDVDTVDDLKVLRAIAGFNVEQPQNCYPIGLEGAVIQYKH